MRGWYDGAMPDIDSERDRLIKQLIELNKYIQFETLLRYGDRDHKRIERLKEERRSAQYKLDHLGEE